MLRLLAALGLLVPTIGGPALADEPKRVELEVGEKRKLGGFRPLCDDPSIVGIADGVFEGLKAGETICSASSGSPLGLRQVYRVVVRPKPSNDGHGTGRRG